jgi:hypothetical protein
MFDKPYINKTNPYKPEHSNNTITRTIYYGEVVSIDDPTDGGRIKVKINDLDNRTSIVDDLPWCFPLTPKYFHIYPQIGEMVRILIEDVKYPQRNRFWVGSIISQLQKIKYDSKLTALSTTQQGILNPEAAISKYPDAVDVYPDKKDIAIIGRINTDIILKENRVVIRAGKHENDNVLKLNTKNPAQVLLNFEPKPDDGNYYSNNIITGDKIALISHDGIPKFKTTKLTPENRNEIFEKSHPIPRGDLVVEAFNVIRKAILQHLHGYSNTVADKNDIINDLEKINFEAILQKNIVIN